MDETTESEVEKIFLGYETKIKERTREYEGRKLEFERFQGEYNRIVKDVIKPIMEEVGSYIKKLGHDYRITESEEELTMVVIPKTITNRISLDQPSITFQKWNTEMRVSKRPLLDSGRSSQNARVEDITKSYVERSILDVMKDWERNTK
jgi:uncharacterized protein YifE (UPF0438 family)